MFKDLSHLNQQELLEFMEKYYTKTISLKSLFQEYQLCPNPIDIHKNFPPIILEDKKCPHCLKAMQYKRKSKLYHFQGYDPSEAYCPQCGHRNWAFCHCNICEQVKLEKERSKREFIFNRYSSIKERAKPISIQDLTLEQRLQYGAVIKKFITEDLQRIEINLCNYLSPIPEIIQEMIRNQTLLIDPNSPSNHFDDDFDHKKNEMWLIPNLSKDVEDNSRHDALLEMISPKELIKQAPDEIFQMWKKICLQKSLELLNHSFKTHLLSFSFGKKTLLILEQITQKIPISKMGYIFYISADKAIAYASRKGLNKKHAANCVVSFCEKYATRAVKESWNISDRISSLTLIESFFYYNVLEIGDEGLKIIPSIEFFSSYQ